MSYSLNCLKGAIYIGDYRGLYNLRFRVQGLGCKGGSIGDYIGFRV